MGNRAVTGMLMRRGVLARQPLVSGAAVHEVRVSDRARKVMVNDLAVLEIALPEKGESTLSSDYEEPPGPSLSILRIRLKAPAGSRVRLTTGYRAAMNAAAHRWAIRVEQDQQGDVEGHIAPGTWVQQVTSDPPPPPRADFAPTPPPKRSPAPKPAPKPAPAPAPSRRDTVLQHLHEGRWDTDDLAAELSDDEMGALTPKDRVDLIAEIGSGIFVGDEDETTIDRLLETTPDGDYEAVAALLTGDRKLLKTLDSAIDGEEYQRYLAILTKILINARAEEDLLSAIDNAPELAWTGPGLHPEQATYAIEWTSDGKMRIRRWLGVVGLQGEAAPIVVRPQDIVVVRFVYDEPEAGAKAGEFRAMPAAAFMGLVNLKFKRDVWLAVNVALVFGGVGGVVGGATRLARVLAALDVAINAANIGVELYRAQIASTPNGQKFLRAWDTLQTVIAVYGLARVAMRIPQAIRNARSFWNAARGGVLERGSTRAVNDTEQNLKKVEQALADVEQEAKTSPDDVKRRIFNKPTTTGDPTLPAGQGYTDKYGNIEYSTAGSPTDQRLALLHEKVHSFLSPKLKLLRDLRADIGMAAYNRSHLLKYLEEAMAETYAQVRVHGFSGLPTGIKFPVTNGYVSISRLAAEGAIGAIVVAGYTYWIYLIATKPAPPDPAPVPAPEPAPAVP